jgi:rhodanese-related sulfurtransferase
VYDLEAWESAGGVLTSFETRTADDLFEALQAGEPPQVLDVRSPGDWEIGHLDGSVHRYTPDLKNGVPLELDADRDVWVVCATGFRAVAASTYLEQAGFRPVVVTKGGVPDILHRAATGAAG